MATVIPTSRTTPQVAMARVAALIVLAAVFFRAGGVPIANLDSYADWKYGEWIRAHGSLPTQEPFSPFSDPSRQPNNAGWLGQVISSLAVSGGGLEGAALLHALLEVAKAGLFLVAARRASGSLGLAVVMTVLMEALCWPYTDAVRTRTLAEVCWAALLLACTARMPECSSASGSPTLALSWPGVVAIPLIVACWANLHDTFPAAIGRGIAKEGIGLDANFQSLLFPPLCFLITLLFGQFLDQIRVRRGLRGVFRDHGFRRLALATALSLVAMTFTPHSKEMLSGKLLPALAATLSVRQWPANVPFSTPECLMLLTSGVLVLGALRLSPRRFSATEILLFATFGLTAWFVKGVAPWWLMLAPLLLAPHARALLDTWDPAADRPVQSQPSSPLWPRVIYSLGVLVAVVLLVLSPTVAWLRGQPIPAEARGVAQPYALAEAMAANPEPHRVFNAPYWWGDYLLWRLPSTDGVFWYSHTEGFTPQNRKDAAVLANSDPSSPEWRTLAKRYRLNALVVNARDAPALYAYLKEAPPGGEWKVIKESDGGLAAIRRDE